MNIDGIVFISQMFYNINEHQHEHRFIDEDDIRNKVSIIFQSDCDVINQHLNEEYNFDIINNKNKYYLPNLMRHNGKVEKDQVAHSDFSFTENYIKRKLYQEKEKKTGNKIYSFNTLL